MSWSDALAVLSGLFAGLLSGLIGIGGGLAFVPIMTIGFRFPQPLAQGTSLAAIVPTAIVGGITHIREGNVLLEAAMWMGGGGVVGAILGALLAIQVPGHVLARFWGAFLVFSAWRIGWGALRSAMGAASHPLPGPPPEGGA
jgi:uncharacterized membrane protein YfcA